MHVRASGQHDVYCLCSLSAMFCRLINVYIYTIYIRYKTEMHDTRHIVDAIYMHLFKFILDRIDKN